MKRKHDTTISGSSSRSTVVVSPQPEPHHNLSVYRKHPIDFQELALADSNFREAWKKLQSRQSQQHSGKQSFSSHVDQEFTISLTRALLLRDFNLKLPSIPTGHLCPPLPNRLNYVCWLRELLDGGMDCDDEDSDNDEISNSRRQAPSHHYQGIDIGTGSTCIYPLLLSTSVFSGEGNPALLWKFLATDIDQNSVESSQRNIQANNLQHRIHVVRVPKTANNFANDIMQDADEQQKNCPHQGPILAAMIAADDSNMFRTTAIASQSSETMASPLISSDDSVVANIMACKCFDFVMTNPPFYTSCQEAQGYRAGDGRKRTDMTASEGVYHGGEYSFISDMIHDSMTLRNRITWYTSMIGKKATLKEVHKKLRSLGFGRGNMRTTEFIQGKTRRWGIAWTYQEVPERLKASQMTPFQDLNFSISKNGNEEEEVLSRISQFCQTKGTMLECKRKVSRKDGRNMVTIRFGKSAIPVISSNMQSDTKIDSISNGGRFLIDIIIHTSIPDRDNTGNCVVQASVKVYSDSVKGNMSVQKTLDELKAHVCQTSRYWRRLIGKAK